MSRLQSGMIPSDYKSIHSGVDPSQGTQIPNLRIYYSASKKDIPLYHAIFQALIKKGMVEMYHQNSWGNDKIKAMKAVGVWYLDKTDLCVL